MRSLIFSVFFSFAGIAVFVWIIQHVGFSNIVGAFSEFPWWGIFVVIALTFLNFWIGVVRWQKILRYQGIYVSTRDLWGTWLAGFAFSYLTPISYIGGEAVRTGFLKNRLGIPAHRGFASIAIDKILEGTIWVFIITLGVSFFLITLNASVLGLTRTILIGGTVFSFATALIVFVYVMGFRRKRMMKRILGLFGLQNSQGGMFLQGVEHEIIQFINVRNRVLWESLFLALIKHVVAWTRFLFIVALLGKGFQFGGAFIMLAFSYLGYSAPVPAGLGTFEISQSVVFAGLGFGAESGVALSLLIRAAEMLFVVTGGFFLVRFGIDFFTTNIAKLVKW